MHMVDNMKLMSRWDLYIDNDWCCTDIDIEILCNDRFSEN